MWNRSVDTIARIKTRYQQFNLPLRSDSQKRPAVCCCPPSISFSTRASALDHAGFRICRTGHVLHNWSMQSHVNRSHVTMFNEDIKTKFGWRGCPSPMHQRRFKSGIRTLLLHLFPSRTESYLFPTIVNMRVMVDHVFPRQTSCCVALQSWFQVLAGPCRWHKKEYQWKNGYRWSR